MTIFKRYAIEPTALKGLSDFRYVMEKFGYSEGRLLVTLPGKWGCNFLQGLNVGEVERTKIVAKLATYKSDRMVGSGLSYNPSLAWVENAEAGEKAKFIDEVVVSPETKEQRACPYVVVDDLSEEFFQDNRSAFVPSTADGLVEPAVPLIAASGEITFVDPYFNWGRPQCMKVIARFAKEAVAGKCKSFVIYTSKKVIPKGGESAFRRAFDEALCGFERMTVVAYIVDDAHATQAFHARYLLSRHGGMRYDKGFQISQPPQNIEVSLLDRRHHDQLFRMFAEQEHDFQVDPPFTWESKA